ncbi:MAG: SDR family oxidoreductase [Lachnospiraceae bacterium]|nr:SDR family oxidoreductase [Lachnospiraceae bacterium]
MEARWALITGSSRGIGAAILEKFAANGYHIFAHARKYSQEFEQHLLELEKEYAVEIIPVYFDMTDSEAMQREMRKLIQERRKLHVLVNNAGVIHSGLFQMTEMQTIRDVFEVNLFSAMELTQLALKMMVRKKGGSIVNLSSIGGLDLGMGMCAYGVSKAALAAFTKTLSCELGYYGIRVNAVAPGFVDTRMGQSEEVRAERERLESKKGQLCRLAQPEEIANTVYFLTSGQASYINGQVIRIDGGNQ